MALELGIGKETLQISIADALSTAPNIQPCKACSKVVDNASILRDAEGTGLAALVQIFNEVAPADVPFTPEMGTSIAMAFADNINDETKPQFAIALEYLDAFVAYVTVLEEELGSPVDDSVAFVMQKYGEFVMENDNPNIATYFEILLAGPGGS